MRRLLTASLLVLGLFAPAGAEPARATTIRLHPLASLAGAAERICHGRVVESRVVRDDRGDIWTVYRVRVAEELKEPGIEPGATLVVRQFGGTLDGETHVAVGFPHFRPEEELLLFLAAGEDGYRILNAWQGALRVSEGLSLSGGGPSKSVAAAPRLFPEVGASTLEGFKAAVRTALEGGRP